MRVDTILRSGMRSQTKADYSMFLVVYKRMQLAFFFLVAQNVKVFCGIGVGSKRSDVLR